MQNGLYVALSAEVSLERRLETIAHNVANMNTVGFRASGVTFSDTLARAGDAGVDFVDAGDDYISRRTGGLSKTDNPLDFAIQGDAWFGVSDSGGVAYTRDGRARIDQTGTMTTLTGAPFLDAGGAPILPDGSAGAPTVTADGMITQAGRQVGAIGLFSIPADAKLTRAESSGVIPDKPAEPVLDFTRNGVVQGAVEGANVDPVLEMTKLISVTRTFDGVAAEMARSESSLQDAVRTLGAAS